MPTVTINSTVVDIDEFAWDGCHKIYLVTNQEGKDQLVEYGYDFFPAKDLPEVWENSCALKFISSADLKIQFVDQAYEGEVNIKVKEA